MTFNVEPLENVRYSPGDELRAASINTLAAAVVPRVGMPPNFPITGAVRVSAHTKLSPNSIFTIDTESGEFLDDDGPSFTSADFATTTDDALLQPLFYCLMNIEEGSVGWAFSVPYTEPVKIAAGASFNLGDKAIGSGTSVKADDGGNLMCVGQTLDESVYWFVRLQKAGGGNYGYGVIMEAIPRSTDATAEPPDGMGKVRVDGKSYDKDNPVYDDCACLDLCETEELLEGLQVKLVGPIEYDNPDHDPDDPDSPKTKSYYKAVETNDEYDGLELLSDLADGGTSTVDYTLGDETATFTVHDGLLASGQTLPAGSHVLVKRLGNELTAVDTPNCI